MTEEYAHCPACGYEGIDLDDGCCPDCGSSHATKTIQ